MKTAKQLLKDSIVIDTHLDLLYDVLIKHERGRNNIILEDYMESFKQGNVDVIVSSIFVDSKYLPEMGLKKSMEQISVFYKELDTSNGAFILAKSTDDIIKAKSQGKLAIMLAFEGIEPLSGNVSLLRAFYQLGVRILGLCWSRSNWAADGSRFFNFEYQGYGLTESGRELVQYAQELGMLVDVSHTNEKTFWDVVNISSQPIIATHSNTRRYSNTPRNLSDEQILAISKLNGVIGINGSSLLAKFSDPGNANMDSLADHMVYEKEIASARNICMGFDQCDRIASEAQMPSDQNGGTIFDIIPTHDRLEEFVQVLLRRNFSEKEIGDILGKNVMRVLEKTIG